MELVRRHLAQLPPNFKLPDNVQYLDEQVEVPVLYHYTTFSGFYGIIKEEKLWATNINYLNDYTEFRHAGEVLRRMLEDRKQSVNSDRTINLISAIDSEYNSVSSVGTYVASFSERGDILSQWRGYAKSSGVSIGFRHKELTEIAKNTELVLIKCIYDEEEKRRIIYDILQSHMEGIAEVACDNPNSVRDVARSFVGTFLQFAAAFKHAAFQEEVEWRLVALSTNALDPRLGFRTTDSMLIPHLNIELTRVEETSRHSMKNLGMSTIIVGPNANAGLAHNAISTLMMKKNIHFYVTTGSHAPYRTSV